MALGRKVVSALRVISRSPREFGDRARTFVEGRLDRVAGSAGNYTPLEWEAVIALLTRTTGTNFEAFLGETAVAEIEQHVRQRISEIQGHGPFTLIHNGDFALSRLCYAACRALKPAVVVETGVAYGVTSAFILKALEVNGQGTLHSIDLPPLGAQADHYVGSLIPEALKQRWQLHRGTTRRLLPSVLAQSGPVGLFVHDSLHTYRNMRWEFETVHPHLAPMALVISDDVDGNEAFAKWVARARPTVSATFREIVKNGLCGVAVCRKHA